MQAFRIHLHVKLCNIFLNNPYLALDVKINTTYFNKTVKTEIIFISGEFVMDKHYEYLK